jgi:ribose transport system substrate-binding protein
MADSEISTSLSRPTRRDVLSAALLTAGGTSFNNSAAAAPPDGGTTDAAVIAWNAWRVAHRRTLAVAGAVAGSGEAQAKKLTVAYIAPSLDISYWQWVAYGAKTRAAELGMEYIEMDSHNSPVDQMTNVRTAITRGVDAIVMGPVSSTSTPPVPRHLKEKNVPIAFTGIGPQPGEADYTSAVTANNYDAGKAEGSFICAAAKERGGNKIGMLSLPQDRENAQKYLKGAKESFAADGCELVQVLQTKGLTVREAVDQANDLLTAHPDIKGIYGMYDEAATGAAKVLQTRDLVGKIAIATADGSPTTVKLLRDGVIQGLFLQEAGGQGIEAVQQVFNALTGAPVTKELPLPEPLVTSKDVDSPEAQAKLKRVYPPSAGTY